MNKTINRQHAGIVIFQNVFMTDRSVWYLVTPDLLRQVSEICEQSLFKGWTDKEVYEGIYNLIYPVIGGNEGLHEGVMRSAIMELWAWHGREIAFINDYEIIGIIPIKQQNDNRKLPLT